jgi:hypothetical protein
MKTLKRLFRNKTICAAIWLSLAPPGWAAVAQGGPYVLTKRAWGVSGGPLLQAGGRSMSLAGGEAVAGGHPTHPTAAVHSGYHAGFLGTGGGLRLVRSQIGPSSFFQDDLQVGVPLNASIVLELSDQLLPTSLSQGIVISMRVDHLGRPLKSLVNVRYQYDPSSSTVVITPESVWQGNTLYEVLLTPALQDIDGFSFSGSDRVRFVTALNPVETNVVLHPLIEEQSSPISEALGFGLSRLQINIPSQALADFSWMLANPDPVSSPRGVDPAVIREANRKAVQASGGHARPLHIEEISGFNLQGHPVRALSRPAVLSMSLSSLPTRPQTLALWALDEVHRLWVKIPGSTVDLSAQKVSAPVTRFSVFALMGAIAGSAEDVFVFPNPWRPYGPRAGDGPGQTGSDQGGITFSNVPAECTIQIYTLSGELVRELRHSDLTGSIGQETWDGRTSGGGRAASGVYLWRVESPTDGKNGKLMIIR